MNDSNNALYQAIILLMWKYIQDHKKEFDHLFFSITCVEEVYALKNKQHELFFTMKAAFSFMTSSILLRLSHLPDSDYMLSMNEKINDLMT